MTKEECLNGVKRAMLRFSERVARENQQQSHPIKKYRGTCLVRFGPLDRQMKSKCPCCGRPADRHP